MTKDEWRKYLYYNQDPFPEIPPALLNSMDIKRYIDKGCLIDPDVFEKCRLQPASYKMKFLGEASYWENQDGKLKRKRKILCEGKRFEIKKNSVVYVLLKEQFRLPEYIAARFNLHIDFVHKGLLLGTGPIVHPGFFGNLLIPLHNLTDNDYMVRCDDSLIWVEYTKLSSNSYWINAATMSDTDLQNTPNRSTRPEFLIAGKTIPQYDTDGYLEKAGVDLNRGVQSAFKGALNRTEEIAKRAQHSVNWFKTIGIISSILLLIAIISAVWTGYSLVNDFIAMAHEENRNQIEINRTQQIEIMTNTDEIRETLYHMKHKVENLERDLVILKKDMKNDDN